MTRCEAFALATAALLPGCSDNGAGAWSLVALSVAMLGWPLALLLRGKLDDWRSLAEYAVLWERRGNWASACGQTLEATDAWDRADRCEAAVPRPLRAAYIARARRAASTVAALALCSLLPACSDATWAAQATGWAVLLLVALFGLHALSDRARRKAAERPQCRLLLELHRWGPVCDGGELISALRLSPEDLAGHMDELRRLGCVEHEPSSDPPWRDLWKLTDEGRRVAARIVSAKASP